MQTVRKFLPANPEQSLKCPRVITEEQAEAAVAYWVERRVHHATWKMKSLGYTQAMIEQKLGTTNLKPTDQEREQIIEEANRRFYFALEAERESEARKKREAEERENMISFWKAERFHRYFKQSCLEQFGQFIDDEGTKLLYKSVCFYLAGDDRFEKELKFDWNKGLLVYGSAGIGKTSIFRIMAPNPIRPLKIYSMLDIAEEVKESGSCTINTMATILIDDVGTEPELINHFGTKVNWFKDFIESYYHHHRGFGNLIITTNLGGREIEERYGYRVRSRIREMFNMIPVTGNDKRK